MTTAQPLDRKKQQVHWHSPYIVFCYAPSSRHRGIVAAGKLRPQHGTLSHLELPGLLVNSALLGCRSEPRRGLCVTPVASITASAERCSPPALSQPRGRAPVRSSFLRRARHCALAGERSAAGMPARHLARSVFSPSLLFSALCIGERLSCVHYRRRPPRGRAKASVQMDGLPTKWSATCWPTSRLRFGRQIPLQISRLNADAPCARPNAISAGSAIGPVTRSRSSSAKFSSATPCATSRSCRSDRSAA